MKHYLQRHAEPEVGAAVDLPGQWRNALVMPAYREPAGCLHQFRAVCNDTLIILVLNRPDTDTETGWAEEFLAALPTACWRRENLSLHSDALDILLVDRCLDGPALPHRQGVGLARKIGADIALSLFARGTISQPWIGNTDADATLPTDYWQALNSQPRDVASCVFPFTHNCDAGEADWPIRCYEFHQLYYVAGLRHAGSPYAWPTVGSCLAFHAEAYAKVRGFPRRSGGEDFYLLNKIAKAGGVRHLPGPAIELSARRSDRVPFGTGPALTQIATLAGPEAYCSYHPLSFEYLKVLLATLHDRATGSGSIAPANKAGIDPAMFEALWTVFDCEGAVAKARANSRSAGQTWRHLMTWFDGFQTLKWIHRCRDYLPDQPLPAITEIWQQREWSVPPPANGQIDDHNSLVEALHRRLADGKVRGVSHLGP